MNMVSKPGAPSVDDIKALRSREVGAAFDIDALGRLALVQRMLQNSLTVANRDTGNHLFGTSVDWGVGPNGQAIVREINIPPSSRQTIENFQFMTIWFRQVRVDTPIELTNNANYACFYEVNKLLSSGQPQPGEIVNPWPDAVALYALDPGERLIVVPVGMHRYVLDHDPALRCIDPPLRVEKA